MEPFFWGAAAAVVFAVMARGFVLVRADPLGHLSTEDQALIKAPVKKRRRTSLFTKFGLWLGPEIAGIMGQAYQGFISKRLQYAQSQQFATVADFFAMKARLVLLFGVGAIAVFALTQNIWLSLLLFLVGFFIPDLVLHSAGVKRQIEIEHDLPDFLDVLAVTVSAGLSFRGALQRVIERTEGPLAEEMQLTMRQLDVGASRYEAFRELKDRTKSQAMEAFVTSLLQAEELGSPLIDSLEQIATDIRQRRAQRARQEASKASPKIASVVTLVMVPGTMVIILVSIFFIVDIDFGSIFGDGF